MKQIVLEHPGRLVVGELGLPGPVGEGQALVRVRRIGICGTDYHAFRGRQPFFTYPRRLGHEVGAEIVEIADNPFGLKAGDHCAVEPYLNCGNCIACRNGKTNCCVHLQCLGVHTDGAACEFIVSPIDKLHASTCLSFEQLAIVEPLGIGAHGVSRASLQAGEWALVIGAGPIGLAATQFALAARAHVVVADVNPQRLEFCRQHLGVQFLIDARSEILPQLEAICSNELATAVFDCTGNQQSMQGAFRYVAHGGRLVFIGLGQFDITFNDPEFHRRELTLLSSRNSTGADFKRIIGMMERGEIDTRPWVTHRCRFDDMITEFPNWLEPKSGVIKAIVEL